jgi:hypothetical protein
VKNLTDADGLRSLSTNSQDAECGIRDGVGLRGCRVGKNCGRCLRSCDFLFCKVADGGAPAQPGSTLSIKKQNVRSCAVRAQTPVPKCLLEKRPLPGGKLLMWARGVLFCLGELTNSTYALLWTFALLQTMYVHMYIH